jgi:hypothetical protein
MSSGRERPHDSLYLSSSRGHETSQWKTFLSPELFVGQTICPQPPFSVEEYRKTQQDTVGHSRTQTARRADALPRLFLKSETSIDFHRLVCMALCPFPEYDDFGIRNEIMIVRTTSERTVKMGTTVKLKNGVFWVVTPCGSGN